MDSFKVILGEPPIINFYIYSIYKLKLKFTDFKLVGLLRKFVCRYPYALVLNAVNLN